VTVTASAAQNNFDVVVIATASSTGECTRT